MITIHEFSSFFGNRRISTVLPETLFLRRVFVLHRSRSHLIHIGRIQGKDVNLAAVLLAHGWTTNRAAESPPPGDRIGRSLSKEDYPEAVENAGFSLCFVVWFSHAKQRNARLKPMIQEEIE